jgi:monoamine oxidase
MKVDRKQIGTVVIVGAGVGGLQAALDLADSGFMVHLVSRDPAVGGTMAMLDKTFPTGDCAALAENGGEQPSPEYQNPHVGGGQRHIGGRRQLHPYGQPEGALR